MIFKVKSKTSTSGESIALADIVINLFVFFFITFGLNTSFDPAQKGTLPIELPKSSLSTVEKTQKPVTLSIDRGGNVYLGPRKIPSDKLKTMLNHELSLRKDKSVLVQADRSISLQTFVSILDIVKTTQARSVAIQTKL